MSFGHNFRPQTDGLFSPFGSSTHGSVHPNWLWNAATRVNGTNTYQPTPRKHQTTRSPEPSLCVRAKLWYNWYTRGFYVFAFGIARDVPSSTNKYKQYSPNYPNSKASIFSCSSSFPEQYPNVPQTPDNYQTDTKHTKNNRNTSKIPKYKRFRSHPQVFVPNFVFFVSPRCFGMFWYC